MSNKIAEHIYDTPLTQEISDSYLEYSYAVITSRAVPDVRDGLKPVHRRLLYSMREARLTPDHAHVKSARVVGDTMGKYHPHGDCLAGDTQVRGLDNQIYTMKELAENHNELWVLAADNNGEPVAARAHSFRIGQYATELFHVTLVDGSKVTVTGNHPFRTLDGQWVKAENLEPGMLLTMFGSSESDPTPDRVAVELGLWGEISQQVPCEVVNIEIETLDTPTPMYDFTVDDYENMFIIAGNHAGFLTWVCVHNSSSYEALVRMAQPFSLNTPLVDGHGNFGSPNDGAAAMRYTECRLSKNAMGLVGELGERTVNMIPNYDGSLTEPEVLPAEFPNLLVNGTSGIAVGMSTSILPHNMGDVLAATVLLLKKPKVSDGELQAIVQAPDVPTGGIVVASEEELTELYASGRGTIKIRGEATVEPLPGSRGRYGIVFTTLPYQVGTEKVTAAIKTEIGKGRLAGVSDVKDLSDRRHGMRFVVETKTGANPQHVLAELYKYTPLESSYGNHHLALVDGKPVTLSLRDLLQGFLDFRELTVKNRTQHRYDVAQARHHIVEGLLTALDAIDKVVKIIRAAKNTAEAKTGLQKAFKFSDKQVTHILEMPLRRLTSLEINELRAEEKTLTATMTYLQGILTDRKKLVKLVTDELTKLQKTQTPRKTHILNKTDNTDSIVDGGTDSTLPNNPVTVHLTSTGLIVRTSVDGEPETTTKRTQTPHPSLTHTLPDIPLHNTILAISNLGNAYRVPAISVPTLPAKPAGKYHYGVPVSELTETPLVSGEHIVAIAPETDTGVITVGTRNGVVKNVSPDYPTRGDMFPIVSLKNGDEVVNAHYSAEADDLHVVFVSTHGQLLHFPIATVRAQGRSGGGMAGMKLPTGEHVVSVTVTPVTSDVHVTVASSEGIKTTPLTDYPQKGRGGQGVRAYKFRANEPNHIVASIVTSQPVNASHQGKHVPLPKQYAGKRDGTGTPHTLGDFEFGYQ